MTINVNTMDCFAPYPSGMYSSTFNPDGPGAKAFEQVLRARDLLLEHYADVLPEMVLCEARGMVYGCHSPERYESLFLYWVLDWLGYKVNDETHTNYSAILAKIREDKNHPNWAEWYEKAHEDKTRRCKAPIYPID